MKYLISLVFSFCIIFPSVAQTEEDKKVQVGLGMAKISDGYTFELSLKTLVTDRIYMKQQLTNLADEHYGAGASVGYIIVDKKRTEIGLGVEMNYRYAPARNDNVDGADRFDVTLPLYANVWLSNRWGIQASVAPSVIHTSDIINDDDFALFLRLGAVLRL